MPVKFSKQEIVDKIYQDTGMNKSDIKLVCNAVFDTIKDALIGGFVIELRGFGTFSVRVRNARKKARNPRTGESVEAYAHGIASFKPGSELKRSVWPLKDKPKNKPQDLPPSDI
jgi:nucleoid DNA-binding protein